MMQVGQILCSWSRVSAFLSRACDEAVLVHPPSALLSPKICKNPLDGAVAVSMRAVQVERWDILESNGKGHAHAAVSIAETLRTGQSCQEATNHVVANQVEAKRVLECRLVNLIRLMNGAARLARYHRQYVFHTSGAVVLSGTT